MYGKKPHIDAKQLKDIQKLIEREEDELIKRIKRCESKITIVIR